VCVSETDNGTDNAGLPPYQVAVRLRSDIDEGIDWAGSRKKRFRQAASAVRLAALALSVASTIILGLQDLDFWTGLAFALIAVATAITGIEPFFNWRSRWVLMEEMQYRLRRIRDDLNYALLRTPPQHLRFDDVDAFFSRTQEVWKDTSERWLEMRSADRSPGG
jgi:Protein of unknown function (DUF4231)